MVFSLLALAFLVSSQIEKLENKPEKFNACLFLTRLKIKTEVEELNKLMPLAQSEEKLGNRVSSDMLMKCYSSIPVDLAIEIAMIGETDLTLEDRYNEYVTVDYEAYKESGFELTEEHQKFFEDIKQMKEDAEIASMKGPEAAPPLPPVGIWYILIVIVLFGGFFYWASSKVLNKPEKLKGKDRKKKKN